MQNVPIHPAMATKRYTPPRRAQVATDHIPLLHPDDPSHAIQEHWHAHCRQFQLAREEDQKLLDEIWQNVVNKVAIVSESDKTWSESLQSWVYFIRWSDITLVVPPVNA